MVSEMDETPGSLLPYLLDVVVDVYEGERSSEDLPHGSGRATFKNGASYEGSWSKGYMHGQGTYVWQDGLQFKGDFDMNGIQGTGTYSWPNGDVYFGEVKNGERHGLGKMFLRREGTCYDGQWCNGKKHGQGKLIYNTNTTEDQENGDDIGTCYYSGDWQDDYKHGQGTMKYATGNVYQGSWHKGKKEGVGRMDYKENNSFYVGDWKNDLPDGDGEHVWKDEEKTRKNPYLQTFNRYKGQFKDGLRHGKGMFAYATGASYKGDWNKNLKEGYGTFVYEDGTVFTGEFKQDRLPSRRQTGGGSSPGSSVKVDIFDLIGETSESKSNTDLANSILRYNSELRGIYRKYSQVPIHQNSEGQSDMCTASLLTEQIVQILKDHWVLDLDYQLWQARDVISEVCAKLLKPTDDHYCENGSVSVLYKDLVEILVRIGYTKYHWIESPAQRFATLVEKDILPDMESQSQWHYLASPSSSATLSAHKEKLRSLFDALLSSSSEKEGSFQVSAKDVLKLLKSKDLLAEEEKVSEVEAVETETDESTTDQKGEEDVVEEGKESADGGNDQKGEEPKEDGEGEKTEAESTEAAPTQEGEAADGETLEDKPEEDAVEDEGSKEGEAEKEEDKNKLTLKLAIKCLHAANFGSPLSKEELCASDDIGLFGTAVSMKFPEFVDALALCADVAYDAEEAFEKKFETFVSVISA